jgi:methyl-accepting chemotaxis protein
MTVEQVHQIRKSFERVEAMGHVAALVFYQRLFAMAPAVRPLFHTNIETQAKKLTDMLAAAISLLERPGELQSVLHRLGARHVDYGAKAEHYPVVAQALLDMLAEVLGAEFTPTLRGAWSEMLHIVSNTMIEGAEKAAANSQRTAA